MTEKLLIDSFDKNYSEILKNIEIAAKKAGKKPEDIILLAATKTVDSAIINHAIESGIKYTGDNKVQELLQKEADLIPVIKHFIGHLQTNKVKDIITRVTMIESVDSIKLAKEISKQALKHNQTMDILLEINIGNEESKHGFLYENVLENVREIASLEGIKIKGLMAIPPICEKMEENRKYFQKMYKLFIDIGSQNIDNVNMEYLSMGMSDDYMIAIEEGANIIRLGTALFGKRVYN